MPPALEDWVALRLLALRPRVAQMLLEIPHWNELIRDPSGLKQFLIEATTGRFSLAQLDGLAERSQQLLERLAKLECVAVALDSASYPPLLKTLFDPPPVLFVRGDPTILAEPQVAIVGSRKSSSLGRATAERLATDLATAGIHVTSGLALGIDAAAHRGAISKSVRLDAKSDKETAQDFLSQTSERFGKTVAVMATGPDQIYPTRNANLADQILVSGGAIITEQIPGTQPRPFLFPERNRIISGLSLGTLIIEASIKSGSLVTAKLALEQGREVMAIPGALNNPGAQGCHHLIKQGAALVENVEDILLALHKELREFTPYVKSAPANNNHSPLDPLLHLIGKEQPSLDQLCLMSGMAISELQIKLTEYELQGVIQREGVRFVLVSSSGRMSP